MSHLLLWRADSPRPSGEGAVQPLAHWAWGASIAPVTLDFTPRKIPMWKIKLLI